MNSKIVIEDYSPKWATDFQTLKKIFSESLGELAIDIHHVGSTSVSGLAAKPIIDIDIVIENDRLLPQVSERLSSIGYKNAGDLGIQDRFAFKQTTAHSFQMPEIVHHLYVCPRDSISLKNHLTLRHFLRFNKEKAGQYAALKKELAAKYSSDIDLYIEHKTQFIIEILKECGFDKETLLRIKEQNKSK